MSDPSDDYEPTEAEIMEAITDATKKAAGTIGEAAQQVVGRLLLKGMTPKAALGLSDGAVEGLYSQAYLLFQSGQYSDANTILRLLMIVDPIDPRFPMGIAASLHLEKSYELAIEMYALCNTLNPDDPLPMYHASDCYILLGQTAQAIQSLHTVIDICKRRGASLEPLQERAESMLKVFEEPQINANSSENPEKKKKKKKKVTE